MTKSTSYGASRVTRHGTETSRLMATAKSIVVTGFGAGLPVACGMFSKGNRHHEEKAQRTT